MKANYGGSAKKHNQSIQSNPTILHQSSVHVFTIQGGLHISPKARRDLVRTKLIEFCEQGYPYCKISNRDKNYESFEEIHADLLVILPSLPCKLNMWFDGKNYLILYREGVYDPVVWR